MKAKREPSKKACAYHARAVAQACSNAIDLLMDDTGPLARLPREIRASIQGDLDSAIRTLDAAQENAEECAEKLDGEA